MPVQVDGDYLGEHAELHWGVVTFLENEHRKLRETVTGLSPSDLTRRSPRGVWTYGEEIHGIAAHDLYHTGQIQLIKRLM